jgi:hypothetical protein
MMIQDEGIDVVGTPFDKINFIGERVEATGGAPGVVNILIEGRKFDAFYDQTPDVILSASPTFTDVPLDTQRVIDGDFSHTAGNAEVTINTSGNYLVLARVSTIMTASNSRSTSQMRVLLNGTLIPGSLGAMYNRAVNRGDNMAFVSLILNLSTGDVIKIQATLLTGGGTVRLLSQGCGLTIVNI